MAKLSYTFHEDIQGIFFDDISDLIRCIFIGMKDTSNKTIDAQDEHLRPGAFQGK